MSSENPHKGHRQRVKEQFLQNGLENNPQHLTLELLLYYSIPQKDTNEIAHSLIDTFGSLSGVLDASYEELIKVKGVKENTAILLTMMPQLFREYTKDKTENKPLLSSAAATEKYLVSKFTSYQKEVVLLLCLDNMSRLNNCCMISKGTLSKAVISNRTLVETALRNNAASVILAHNHPNGMAVPSKDDVYSTENIINVMSQLDINVLDHIIVADKDSFSMASHPRYARMFNNNL